MSNWLKTTLLLFIPLILIPILVLALQQYQTKSRTPKQLFKPTPTIILPTPTQISKKTGVDLSYIWLYTNENVSVVAKNASNVFVGEEFVEQPLQDPVSGKKSGKPTKEFLYVKPSSGDYLVTISVPKEQEYKLLVLLYDREGNHKTSSFSGILKPNKNIIYKIYFDKENSANSYIKQ